MWLSPFSSQDHATPTRQVWDRKAGHVPKGPDDLRGRAGGRPCHISVPGGMLPKCNVPLLTVVLVRRSPSRAVKHQKRTGPNSGDDGRSARVADTGYRCYLVPSIRLPHFNPRTRMRFPMSSCSRRWFLRAGSTIAAAFAATKAGHNTILAAGPGGAGQGGAHKKPIAVSTYSK